MLPPIVQVPSEASDSGKSRSAFRRLLHALQRDAGLGRHRVAGGSTSRTRSRRCSDSTISGPLGGNLAADQPGIAALRHDGDAGRARQRHGLGHLRRRAWLDDGKGLAAEDVAWLAQVRRHVAGRGNDVARPDGAGQRLEEVGVLP